MNQNSRKLLGISEEFAFVSIGDDAAPYDSEKAAIDLLKAKDWRSIISFIEHHALNGHFCWYVDDESFDMYAKDVFAKAPEFNNPESEGSLLEVLAAPDMPDYIECSNELDCLVSVISIRELMHVRDSLRGMVLMAAVALSADDDAVKKVRLGPCINMDAWTLGEVELEEAGFSPGGLLDSDKLSNDAYSLERSSAPGVDVIGNEFRFDARVATETDAIRATCGNLAALAMEQLSGHRLDFSTLVCADFIGEDDWGYRFDVKRGFTLDHVMPSLRPWWEPICDAVTTAILKGRVSVCKNCGIPFIAERKGAITCSPSCRTSLCIKRKEAKPAC